MNRLAAFARDRDETGVVDAIYHIKNNNATRSAVQIAIGLGASIETVTALLRVAVARGDVATVRVIYEACTSVTVFDIVSLIRTWQTGHVVSGIREFVVAPDELRAAEISRLSPAYAEYRRWRYDELRRVYTPMTAHLVNEWIL